MRNAKVLLVVGIAIGLTLAVAGTMFFARPYTFHGSVIDPAVAAADFTLTDQNGQPFRLSDQKGKVALIFFGYTNCPDVCPTTLTQFKKIRAQLGKSADRVEFVLITVDPQRDTPDRLRDYLAGFDPTFIGLTGSLPDLQAAYHEYGVYQAIPTPEPDYTVDHTTRIYAVDPRGNLRVTYTIDTAVEDVARDVQQLIKEN